MSKPLPSNDTELQDMLVNIARMKNTIVVGSDDGQLPHIAMALDKKMPTAQQADLVQKMFSGLFLMYAGISKHADMSMDDCLENAAEAMTAAISTVYRNGVNVMHQPTVH